MIALPESSSRNNDLRCLALTHLCPVAPQTALAADSDGTAEFFAGLVDFDGVLGSEHEHLEEELGRVLSAGC